MKHRDKFWIAVISTNRPNNVTPIQKVLGCEVTFYVNKGEGRIYKMAGATNVVECDKNICAARNKAMRHAAMFDLICVQVSDDLKKMVRFDSGKRVAVTFDDTIDYISYEMERVGAMLGSTAITDNMLNYRGKNFVYDKLIVNDLILISPRNNILYDEQAQLKEDYDMFVEQMLTYGRVCRCEAIAGSFPHRDNFGGANTYRTTDEELKRNTYVMNKRSGIIVAHKRRPNQVEIDYKELKARMK